MKFKIKPAELLDIYTKHNDYLNMLSKCNTEKRTSMFIDAARKAECDNIGGAKSIQLFNLMHNISETNPENFLNDYLPLYSEDIILKSDMLYTGWLPMIATIVKNDEKHNNDISVIFRNNQYITLSADNTDDNFSIPASQLTDEDKFCRIIAAFALGESFNDIIKLIRKQSDKKDDDVEKSKSTSYNSRYSQTFFNKLRLKHDTLAEIYDTLYASNNTVKESAGLPFDKYKESIINTLIDNMGYNIDEVHDYMTYELASHMKVPKKSISVDTFEYTHNCFKLSPNRYILSNCMELHLTVTKNNECEYNPVITLQVTDCLKSDDNPVIKISASQLDLKHNNTAGLSVIYKNNNALIDFIMCAVCNISVNALYNTSPALSSCSDIYKLCTTLMTDHMGFTISKPDTIMPVLMQILLNVYLLYIS